MALSCVAAAALWLNSGCGPIRYVSGVTGDAAAAVEEARQAGADSLAPYWWTLAVEYLTRARIEAADSDWQAANRFGRLAEQAATTAVSEAAAAAADPGRRPRTAPAVAPAKESSLLRRDRAADAQSTVGLLKNKGVLFIGFRRTSTTLYWLGGRNPPIMGFRHFDSALNRVERTP
jgi:Domain of unknown function (DUF4398)